VHQPGTSTIQRARAQCSARARDPNLFLLGLLAYGIAACSGDPNHTAQARTAHRTSAGSIELPSAAYRPVALGSVGTITGTVEIDGSAPADSIVTPTRDREQCGSAYPDSSIVVRGRALANAVLWLSDVKEGKSLPIERRTEIVNEDCRLVPRVQALVAGTTVNIRNEDRLAHTTRFVRGGAGGDTLAAVPLTDDGQVVPNEHIAAKAGMVAAACVQHPWTHGYIAVFESPYFAVTDESGAFHIDSVPPGKYHLLAWHERGEAQVEREVEVTATSTSRVEIKLRLK
jgi:carboxypeptidase family protein